MPVKAVVFDIGETILSEERIWRVWADWLGVSHGEVFAALGSVVERGERNQRVFDLFGKTFKSEDEDEMLAEAGLSVALGVEDLYADATPCFEALRGEGYVLGLAGNQPRSIADMLRQKLTGLDFIAVSDEWGVKKPAPEFFSRLVELTGLTPAEVAYVGDRVGYDVVPARAAGLVSVFLRRGPWAIVESRRPEAAQADIVITNLGELPVALRGT